MNIIKEIFEQIKKRSCLKIFAGVFLIVLGLILHLIPLFPAGWIIVIGLELLGIRLLLWDKIKGRMSNSKNFTKTRE